MDNPVDHITPAQAAAERILVRSGFRVTKVSFNYFENPQDGVVIFMSRYRRTSLHLAQVESDGKVNGQTAKDFLARF